MRGTRAVDIEVDGGIDVATAPRAAEAGANVFVAGSAVFGHERPWEAADEIRESVVARHGVVDSVGDSTGMSTAWRVSLVTQANFVNGG